MNNHNSALALQKFAFDWRRPHQVAQDAQITDLTIKHYIAQYELIRQNSGAVLFSKACCNVVDRWISFCPNTLFPRIVFLLISCHRSGTSQIEKLRSRSKSKNNLREAIDLVEKLEAQTLGYASTYGEFTAGVIYKAFKAIIVPIWRRASEEIPETAVRGKRKRGPKNYYESIEPLMTLVSLAGRDLGQSQTQIIKDLIQIRMNDGPKVTFDTMRMALQGALARHGDRALQILS